MLDPSEELALFSPLRNHTLSVRLTGPDREPAFAQLLDDWDAHLAATVAPGDVDSAAAVRWPTRDLVGLRQLALRGFAPLTVVAGRRAGTVVSGSPDVTVRAATPSDVEVLVDHAVELLRADVPYGVLTERAAQREILRAEFDSLLADEAADVLVAHDGDRLLGYVTAQSEPGSEWIAELVSVERMRYIPAMYVAPGARTAGVGRALAERMHRTIDASGTDLTLLHYALPSPTSAPFWSRQGYRPLWTLWQRRPALGSPRQ